MRKVIIVWRIEQTPSNTYSSTVWYLFSHALSILKSSEWQPGGPCQVRKSLYEKDVLFVTGPKPIDKTLGEGQAPSYI